MYCVRPGEQAGREEEEEEESKRTSYVGCFKQRDPKCDGEDDEDCRDYAFGDVRFSKGARVSKVLGDPAELG